VCSWNIRRGLITHEEELKIILSQEKTDVMFLCETDVHHIKSNTYKIEEYETILQLKENDNPKVRETALIRSTITPWITQCGDLMSPMFPSIWLQYKAPNGKKPLSGATTVNGIMRANIPSLTKRAV
jgi:hypothetical protein